MQKWRTRSIVTTCWRCGRAAIPGERICYLDVLFLARIATNAYVAVGRRKGKLAPKEHVAEALAFIASGHERHKAPHVGCPLCIR